MIELLISACLTAAPAPAGKCRDFSLLFDAREMSVMTCMTQSQPLIALWSERHPDWQVSRWRCGDYSRTISRI